MLVSVTLVFACGCREFEIRLILPKKKNVIHDKVLMLKGLFDCLCAPRDPMFLFLSFGRTPLIDFGSFII